MFWGKRLTRLETLQTEIQRQLETIVTALIVTEPRTGLAAEAYDGLRRNVSYAAQERRRLLSQLVTLADAIDRGATLETLRERCEQWCHEAGLRRHTDPAAEPDWYRVVEGEGTGLELVEPAWVDAASGTLVRQGSARRVQAPGREPAPVSTPESPVDAAEPAGEIEAPSGAEGSEEAEPAAAAEPAGTDTSGEQR